MGLCQSDPGLQRTLQETGGVVRALVIANNYDYDPPNALAGIPDGLKIKEIMEGCGVEDITVLFDNAPMGDPSFPTLPNVLKAIKAISERTDPDDFFIFFYAGHGETVADRPPKDEEDGFDSAFVLPGPRGELEEQYFFIDDDVCKTLEDEFNKEVRIIMICDCCHSGSIGDVETFAWKRPIISISACQDSQESLDMGVGGVLTIAIEMATRDLAIKKGNKEYSIQTLFQKLDTYVDKFTDKEQKMNMQHKNCDPKNVPWPLIRPFWKTFNTRK